MSEERWDVPSVKLARIAGAEEPPQFRECGRCRHRHPRGERCGYQVDGATVSTCRCEQ